MDDQVGNIDSDTGTLAILIRICYVNKPDQSHE